MGRVLVLGSINVDLVTHVQRHPAPGETVLGEGLTRLAGGKGANQAVAAARAGADVAMLGAVGDDEAGQAYVERLQRLGVDTSGVVVRQGEPTGTALIVVDASGENTIVVAVLLAQLEVPLETVARACTIAARREVRIVLNAAPYAVLPGDAFSLGDPVVVNEHEARLLADAAGLPGSLLVTFGARGADWDGLRAPAVAVAEDEVVDTTGAGDAFCGALAAALARGDDRESALRAAAAAGAEAVRHHGAQPDGRL